MKLKISTVIFCLFIFLGSAFAQNEAELIDEFSELSCNDILSRSDNLLNELNKTPMAVAYIVFYEGKHSQLFYNKKTKELDYRLVNPKRGEALNKAPSIILDYLTRHRKLTKEKIVLIDGGFRENFGVELWIARNSVDQPKPTPTLEGKDIKFRKGKASKLVNCILLM